MNELELYIHIPFCMKKCNYCDFLSAPADEESQSAYMEGLKREIAFYGNSILKGRILDTIYIGGGTPSFVRESYIGELMKEVRRCFIVRKNAEITIECNPGSLTEEKLDCYRRAGINRLSIGLQSADEEELRTLGRAHTFEQFLHNYEMARNFGFDNINLDLMDSLPGQTTEKFYRTLFSAVKLNPEHISCYTLTIEKGTPFYDRYKFDMVKVQAGMTPEELPTEDVSYQIGKMTQDFLAQHGYTRYEISNYAKKGCACRHNTGYWKRKEYLGVGLGAASLVGEVRYSNLRDLKKYIENSSRIGTGMILDEAAGKEIFGTNLHENAQWVSKNAQMEEFMFLGLRMTEGIEKSRFYQTFGFTVDYVYGDVIRKLSEEGMLVETQTRLFLTETGMDLNNYAVSEFLL